jgi:hypothetical protein
LPFVGIDELAGRPHVLVDGAARRGTVLTLSHWPASPTPRALWRDLSAEIALAYLDAPELWRDAEAVTLDHLDADGLVSLFALVDPEAARRRAALLVAVARAGDFDVVEDRAAARVAFAIRALIDPARTPLQGGGARGNAWVSACAGQMLGVFGELCNHPERWAELYQDEEAAWDASLAAFDHGVADLEELAGSRLAVVRVARAIPGLSRATAGADAGIGLHPAAIHARTAMPRILVLEPARTTYYDRYETWIRFVSSELARRVDLQPLAGELTSAEPDGRLWAADPPSRTRPVLACERASGIGEAELLAILGRYLESAPAAWEPLDERPACP